MSIEVSIMGDDYRLAAHRQILFDGIVGADEIESLEFAASRVVTAAVRNIARELSAKNQAEIINFAPPAGE